MVFSGVSVATLFTLFIVPVAYRLIAKGSASPLATSRELDEALGEQPDADRLEGVQARG